MAILTTRNAILAEFGRGNVFHTGRYDIQHIMARLENTCRTRCWFTIGEGQSLVYVFMRPGRTPRAVVMGTVPAGINAADVLFEFEQKYKAAGSTEDRDRVCQEFEDFLFDVELTRPDWYAKALAKKK
jgi:hypothetical protein